MPKITTNISGGTLPNLPTFSALTILAILVIFAVCGFLFFSRNPPLVNQDSEGINIIAFGDSLVFGNGSTAGNDFVTLLSKGVGEPIINLGVPGDTSEQGLARIEQVIAQNPKLVFVLFGGNDYLRKVPIETTFKNIDQIVVRLQNAGAAVVLLGVQGGILTDHFEKRFESIAKKRGAVYVPNVLENILGNQSLMSDTIHPNDKGYKLIAEKILKILSKEKVFID